MLSEYKLIVVHYIPIGVVQMVERAIFCDMCEDAHYYRTSLPSSEKVVAILQQPRGGLVAASEDGRV